jgi:hypothetical protein
VRRVLTSFRGNESDCYTTGRSWPDRVGQAEDVTRVRTGCFRQAPVYVLCGVRDAAPSHRRLIPGMNCAPNVALEPDRHLCVQALTAGPVDGHCHCPLIELLNVVSLQSAGNIAGRLLPLWYNYRQIAPSRLVRRDRASEPVPNPGRSLRHSMDAR